MALVVVEMSARALLYPLVMLTTTLTAMTMLILELTPVKLVLVAPKPLVAVIEFTPSLQVEP